MQTISQNNLQLSFSENASKQQVLDLLQTALDKGLTTAALTENNATIKLEVRDLSLARLLQKVNRHFDTVEKQRERWAELKSIPIQVLIDVTGLSRRTMLRRAKRIPQRKKLYRNCTNNGKVRRYAAVREEDIYRMFEELTVRAVQDLITTCHAHPLILRNLTRPLT